VPTPGDGAEHILFQWQCQFPTNSQIEILYNAGMATGTRRTYEQGLYGRPIYGCGMREGSSGKRLTYP